MGLMFRIVVLNGERRGELCGFHWSGADLAAGVLKVEHTLLQLGGKLVPGTPTTRAGERRVYLDAQIAKLLRAHRETQMLEKQFAGEAWQDHDLVFCQADGRPWNPDHVSRRFKRLARDAGVPVIKLHEGGRHTGNSLMGTPRSTRSCGCGSSAHSDRDVNDRYTHTLEEAHRAAAEQTAAYVLGEDGAR